MWVAISFLISMCVLQSSADTVCYDQLGCFTDDYPFGGTPERPVTYLPETPEQINTRFYLDTRRGVDTEIFNDQMTKLGRTTFDPKKMTRFIVHGFVQNGDTAWMNAMSEKLLIVDDVNVIRVGWIGGSLQLNYPQSCSDTEVVAAEIALMINNIKAQWSSSSSDLFHCIGHSLGAQTCGYLGARVSPKIAQITGLDPAGPYYENTPAEVRLDSTDAQFVDVIHSDAEKLKNLGMGINQVSGHIDFWPNDGIAQPGCDQNILSTIVGVDGVVEGAQDFVACNHLRVIDFYMESITSSCPFSGNPCVSYQDYLNGKCNDCTNGNCVSMGYHSKDSISTAMAASNVQPNNYLQTGSMAPFGEWMAYVTVNLGLSSDGFDGNLFLTLYGPSSNTEQEQLSNEGETLELRPSGVYQYTAQYSSFPSGFNKVKLLFTKDEWTIFNQYLVVDSITVWANHEQKLYTFCGDSNKQLSEDTRYSFYTC